MILRERFDGPRGTIIAIMVAIAVAALVLLNSVYGFARTVESRTLEQRAEAQAGQLAQALDAYARLLQNRTEALAAEDFVVQALADGASQVPAGFPGVHSSLLVALGDLGIADSAFVPAMLRNNIEVNLLGMAFNNKSTRAEANFAEGTWVLSAAAPIARREGNGFGGVLVLRADLQTVLRDFLSTESPAGDFALWLIAADGKRQIMTSSSLSDARIAEGYHAATSLAGVEATFAPSQQFLDSTAVSGIPLMLATVCGALILIGLVAFAILQLRLQMRADATRLEDLALYRHGSTTALPSLHYPALVPVGKAILDLRQIQRASPARKSTQNAPRDEADEDALEIELVDEPKPDAVPFEGEQAIILPTEIFRDYDIRGRSVQLTPALAHAIGRSIGSEALECGMDSLVVGADGRESSPLLREHLVQGILATGVDVIDVGTVATPMLYFACHHLRTMSGVMVTGSHNPADQNGFKIMIGGESLRGERIAGLRQRILDSRFVEGQGSYRVTEIDADYCKAIVDDVLVDSPLKVVIDCGNGAASVIAVELFEALGCEIIPLFCALDGRFPNHQPDPSVPANLRHLLAEVAERAADVGIAFDGDGDRIGVVSASGRIVTADRLLMLFARDLLSRNPGADVVFDVKCSRDLPAVIVQHGGRPVMCRSGHSWIKEKMKETGALLGGEFTGHICFKDRWFGFDDALYGAARLLEIMTANSLSLDEILADLPQSIGTSELHINVPEEQKFTLMQRVLKGMALDGARLTKLDGVRAEYRDGWGLVRASNTSAALGCRFEAADKAALQRIQNAFRTELSRLLPGIELPF